MSAEILNTMSSQKELFTWKHEGHMTRTSASGSNGRNSWGIGGNHTTRSTASWHCPSCQVLDLEEEEGLLLQPFLWWPSCLPFRWCFLKRDLDLGRDDLDDDEDEEEEEEEEDLWERLLDFREPALRYLLFMPRWWWYECGEHDLSPCFGLWLDL